MRSGDLLDQAQKTNSDIRVCVAPYTLATMINTEHALRRRRERERENIVPVRLLSRERLVCISVACVIGNAVIIHGA